MIMIIIVVFLTNCRHRHRHHHHRRLGGPRGACGDLDELLQGLGFPRPACLPAPEGQGHRPGPLSGRRARPTNRPTDRP